MRGSTPRVLYDASPAHNPAGTGTFTRGLLTALRSTPGIEVVVSESRGAAFTSIDVGAKRRLGRLANAANHLRYFGVDLPARARRAGCDVIFSPSTLGPMTGRTPSIITVYDLSPIRYASTMHWTNRRYLQTMLRWQVRRAAAICTISNAVRGELLEAFPRRSPQSVHVVTVGPDPELLRATPVPVSGLDEPFFLMVGTIEPRKNHLTALRAFAAYRDRHPSTDATLVMAGSRGWLYQPVLDMIDTLGLRDRVRLLGRVEPGQLHWLYRHARALLFPSLYEGFGIPVLEAFLLECPVIAARIPSVMEIAGEQTATLLEPLDTAQWAAAIEAAAPPSPDMLSRARTRATDFSWEQSAQDLREAVLRTLANGARPTRAEPLAPTGTAGS